jgi:hypothetical protein
MTKTHNEDNIQLNTVQSLIRTAQGLDAQIDIFIKQNGRDKVMASNSLFELADSLHLGRSATRRALASYANALTTSIENKRGEGVK